MIFSYLRRGKNWGTIMTKLFIKRSTFALFILILISPDIFSQVDTVINGINIYRKRYYSAERTETAPRVDGRLDDACWQQGAWEGGFIMGSPAEGAPPSQPSAFRIMYDYSNLYVAYKCYDSEPEKIRVISNLRDKYSGDIVGIAIDGFDDDKTALELNLTAAGQKIDTKLTGDRVFDIGWNAVWEGASALSDSGWTAEMKIPLSQLRYFNVEEQKWGLMIWRRLDRNQEDSFWQVIPKNATSMVYLFGELNGIKDIKRARQLEISPYISTKLIPANNLTRLPGQTYNPFVFGGGLDSKAGISSNFILDLSINPDFGQVEADPSELNLTSYETFFAEKRPFFLEGKDIFTFDLAGSQLFYSRRIGQAPRYNPVLDINERINTPLQSTILGAAKLTGKTTDGLSVGVIEVVTGQEEALISSSDTSYRKKVSPLSSYFVGRIKKEYNKATTIVGGMFTSSNKFIGGSDMSGQLYTNSYTGGLDFIHYMKGKTYYAESKFIFSSIDGSDESMYRLQMENVHRFQRPDAGHLLLDNGLNRMTGTGGSFSFGKKSGSNWRFDLNSSWLSPMLDLNDAGYIRLADMISQGSSVSYVTITPKGIFRTYTVGVDQNASWSFGGEPIDLKTRLFFNSQFSNMWNLNSYLRRNFSSYDPRILRGGSALMSNPFYTFFVNASTANAKDLQLTLTYQNDRNEHDLLKYSNISASLRWFLMKKLMLTGTAAYSDMFQKQQYVLSKTSLAEPAYLFGDLKNKTVEITLKPGIFFTNELSLEYYASVFLSTGNYSDFKRVLDPHSRDYSSRFYIYSDPEIDYNATDNSYSVNDVTQGAYNFNNPDFNFGQFRSNLVLRWEYNPGSIFYLVWTHDQTNQVQTGRMSQSENLSDLFGTIARDVFMVKFNFWFSL